METARENKGYVKVFKVKSFSGLELTKIENAKETMDMEISWEGWQWKIIGSDCSFVRVEYGGNLTENTVWYN